MIAALYVQKAGAYFGLPDVDPWDEARDARLYAGPHRVVAHPPCQRWGRYWHGHRARKATWLYVVGASLPALRWGPCEATARLDAGYHSAAERRAKAGRAYTGGRRLTPRENLATPPAFREALLSIARGAR